jgi:LDH2 family malate/lactate/ureidoglycolate dehydrogenase
MSETVLVEKSEINDFIMRLMQQAGCRTADAQELSDVLVNADYRGHFSHGLNRLEMYFNDIRTGASASDQTVRNLTYSINNTQKYDDRVGPFK